MLFHHRNILALRSEHYEVLPFLPCLSGNNRVENNGDVTHKLKCVCDRIDRLLRLCFDIGFLSLHRWCEDHSNDIECGFIHPEEEINWVGFWTQAIPRISCKRVGYRVLQVVFTERYPIFVICLLAIPG